MMSGPACSSERDDRGRIIHRALDAGTRFVDTTDVNSRSGSAENIGQVRAIGSSKAPASETVEARWGADRRGPQRLRTEQSPYSIHGRPIDERAAAGRR
ncbi:hypothetical protein [Streptomyces sp. NPDC058249]|uniref:hypothetical protein n=1 Tax=Streptomyces sp. NPDC058249 TaxID=3346403 RepID=UPI0036E116D2